MMAKSFRSFLYENFEDVQYVQDNINCLQASKNASAETADYAVRQDYKGVDSAVK